MRENWLSNRIFTSYSDILDHCCDAWNKLTDHPGASCPSLCATGRTGFDQRDLYQTLKQRSKRRTRSERVKCRALSCAPGCSCSTGKN
jgi:hypothetical protein